MRFAQLVIFLLSIVLVGCEGIIVPESPPEWTNIAPDLERASIRIVSRRFFVTEVTFIRSSLTKFRVGVVRASDYGWKHSNVKTLSRASKAIAGVNANFFDERAEPLGLVVSRGIIRQNIHRGGSVLTGIFQASRKQISIIDRDSFNPENALEALQAGPRLLISGSPTEGLHESLTPSKRAGVCVDKEQRILFFAVSSRFIGLDIEQLQSVLLRPGIDCVDALNLDGGGSAQLYVSGTIPGSKSGGEELFIQGDDEVPVMLALFPKEG